MTGSRLTALWHKELLDLRRNPGALLPVAIVGVLTVLLPFAITIGIPIATGHRLADESDLVTASEVVGGTLATLSAEARVQLFLFEQCLLLFLLIPITGAMALAAHAVIGEKQARTLEPLLATPIGTFELLAAKVLGALAPTFAIAFLLLLLYVAGIAALAEPGVLVALATARTFVLVLLVAPAAALVSLQTALVVSSRANDARTAQQFSVLLILPLSGLLIAQFVGWTWLSARSLLLVAAGLVAVWALLAVITVALFDRETILTRWR